MTTTNSTNNFTSPLTNNGQSPFFCALPGMVINTAGTNQALGLNCNTNIQLTPFYVDREQTVAHLSIFVATGVAASSCTLGIYDSVQTAGSTRFPTGAALCVGTVATTSSSAAATVSASTTLKANHLYWAALQLSTNTSLNIQIWQQEMNTSWQTIVTGGLTLPAQIAYPNSYSAGTLPTISVGSIIGLSSAFVATVMMT